MNPLASRSAEQRRAGDPGMPPPPLLDEELEFYEGYPWCLNPYPTARETVAHLGRELDRLEKVGGGWQFGEVATNVFLLSCALLNTVDEYLRGRSLQLPKKAPAVPFFRMFRWLMAKGDGLRHWRRRARVRRWRAGWQAGLDTFFPTLLARTAPDPAVVAVASNTLAALLRSPLPAELLGERIYFPSAFRKHDLTHFDVLALGRKFVARFPDRAQPILLLGLRTAGSYFAPLLRAFLLAEGYRTVEVVTVRPDKGPGAAEQAQLTRCARAGYLAVMVDDSPRTGATLVQGAGVAGKAGFPPQRTAALVPVHPAMRDWRAHPESLALAGMVVLTLEAEEWHKVQLLESMSAGRLREYFQGRYFSDTDLVSLTPAEAFIARVQAPAEEARRARLKRVYEVRLRPPGGQEETRYVLAKSVGWGWLGYHAFLAGQRLAGHVPPVLGLRDGVLYSEWLPQPSHPAPTEDREQRVTAAAAYVAARVRSLRLGTNPFPSLALHQHHESFRLLDWVLSRAHGGLLAANLVRPRLRQRLSRLPCPFPTLIDGKMESSEWVAGPGGGELILDLLRAADRSRLANLFRALLDPRAYRAFVR
jgi:hypothetical protein